MEGIVHVLVLTSMMWLHSLQRVAEHAPAVDIDLAILCDDTAFHLGSGPEVVVHRTPRSLRVRAIVACAILSSHEARRCPRELDINHAVLVYRRFDCVVGAIFGELDGDAVGIEGVLFLVEAVVAEGVRSPKTGLRVVGVEEPAGKLDSHMHATA